MSLIQACDQLLNSTNILHHKYGATNLNVDLVELENKHYSAYVQLRQKLDLLVHQQGLSVEENPARNLILDASMAIMPILKSIHFSDDFNSSNEESLQESLEKLYSLKTGKVFEVMELWKDKQYPELADLISRAKEKAKELQTLQADSIDPSLSQLCELITLLIANLPTNWYDDEKLYKIMNNTQDIAQSIHSFSEQ